MTPARTIVLLTFGCMVGCNRQAVPQHVPLRCVPTKVEDKSGVLWTDDQAVEGIEQGSAPVCIVIHERTISVLWKARWSPDGSGHTRLIETVSRGEADTPVILLDEVSPDTQTLRVAVPARDTIATMKCSEAPPEWVLSTADCP